MLVTWTHSPGIVTGVVMGWVKGTRDAAHLAGTYGRGSVYRGTFAEFRVPANFVQVHPNRGVLACPHADNVASIHRFWLRAFKHGTVRMQVTSGEYTILHQPVRRQTY